MIVWFVWPECTLFDRSSGSRAVDAFWVECTLDEIQAQILPLLSEQAKEKLAEARQEEHGHADRSPDPALPIDHYPNIFFLISRDLASIYPLPSIYPFSSQWNGYNPFVDIERREIDVLSELSALEP